MRARKVIRRCCPSVYRGAYPEPRAARKGGPAVCTGRTSPTVCAGGGFLFILEDMDRPEDYARLRTLAALREALWPAEAWNLLRLCRIPERGLRHACAVGAVAAALAQVLRESRRSGDGPGPGRIPSWRAPEGCCTMFCKGLPSMKGRGPLPGGAGPARGRSYGGGSS